MNKEMICKNCKYHYIEEISFDYPQSCCDKRKAVIEEWFNCNDFEYSDGYIEQLQQKNKHLDEVNCKLRRKIGQLEDNWNYIKKMLKEARQEEFNINGYCGTCTDVDIDFLLGKMQELQGSRE